MDNEGKIHVFALASSIMHKPLHIHCIVFIFLLLSTSRAFVSLMCPCRIFPFPRIGDMPKSLATVFPGLFARVRGIVHRGNYDLFPQNAYSIYIYTYIYIPVHTLLFTSFFFPFVSRQPKKINASDKENVKNFDVTILFIKGLFF